MRSNATVLHRPRPTWLLPWVAAGGLVIYGIAFGPSFRWGLATAFVVGTAWLVGRFDSRRGVWATPDDLLIGNSGRTVVVPKAGSSTLIEDLPSDGLNPRVDLDDSGRNSPRHLYVIPGHPDDPRVQVEAGLGLTPKRLRALAAKIDAAIADRPMSGR